MRVSSPTTRAVNGDAQGGRGTQLRVLSFSQEGRGARNLVGAAHVAPGHVVPATGAGVGPVLDDGRVQMRSPVAVFVVFIEDARTTKEESEVSSAEWNLYRIKFGRSKRSGRHSGNPDPDPDPDLASNGHVMLTERDARLLSRAADWTPPPGGGWRSQPQPVVHGHDANAEEFIGGGRLTLSNSRVLVEADPVIVAVVALVLAVHPAGVHHVVATRAGSDTSLHEARLVVLALGARDVVTVPLAKDVVQGRQ